MSRAVLDIFTVLVLFLCVSNNLVEGISLYSSPDSSTPPTAHSNKQFILLKDVRSVKHGLRELYHLDNARHIHQRRLHEQSPSPSAVAQFPVQNDSTHDRLYYTTISLGSPPKELFVQIDTTMSNMWVSCSSCNGCAQTNNFYDASKSSTSYLISCSDKWCQSRAPTTCTIQQDQCTYSLDYRIQTGAILSGYYVSDVIHLDTNGTSDTYSPVVKFGCTTFMTKSYTGIEGNLGLGRSGESLIFQLHDQSQGASPRIFSHCLSGSDSDSGAGVLVIGYPQVQNVIYTPLVDTWLGYYINMKSISVDGQTLAIDPSTFAFSDVGYSAKGGTEIDSGYRLANLAQEAYFPFMEALTKSVSHSLQLRLINGLHCYPSTSNRFYSVLDEFPMISLNFEGDASMHLRPKDYLIQIDPEGESEVWCIGFMESTNRITVLGDLVLKDKYIVYDLEAERIGWTNYDCSSFINATSSTVSSDAPSVILGLKGDVVIMGDFNEVRKKAKRFGLVFNVQDADAFNLFISNSGLEEAPLGGCSFTWCHKSATKMSKLDHFLIFESLMSACPNILAITLDRYLSDHRPILMRELHYDYGSVSFRFFHYWFEMEGFNKFVEESWEKAHVVETNALIKMMKTLKYLKKKICVWKKIWIIIFRPGDFVYRSNDASHAVDRGKLGPKWEGPYDVTEALGDGAYKLRSMDGTVSQGRGTSPILKGVTSESRLMHGFELQLGLVNKVIHVFISFYS
uniref:Aspartic proteinase-like protein 2 n=1 Tax=Tanacetum cinerariifolium TaxID=118510 RepID=A0A699H3Q4_TANCI|nr:aspartic proteinase-like protein 2 [Tanacetum cinerariifolium]